uniref:Uncharacterized protein n=1 Tax=Anguilla anguilla TaxID=7936 RepID=A0A0E9QIA6_ANGAN
MHFNCNLSLSANIFSPWNAQRIAYFYHFHFKCMLSQAANHYITIDVKYKQRENLSCVQIGYFRGLSVT